MTRRNMWLNVFLIATAQTLTAAPPPQSAGGGGATTKPAAGAVTQPAGNVAPAVRDLLEQMKSAYGNVKTAKFDGTLTTKMFVGGKPNQVVKSITSSFQAPNKFRHRFDDEMTVGSTGEKVFAHNRADNSYILADAPGAKTPANDLPQPIPQIISSQNPSLMLAIEKAPLEALPTLAQNLAAAPDRTIDGKAHKALVATLPNDTDVTLLIDPQTHLLRRLEVKNRGAATQPSASGAEPPVVQLVEMTLDYTVVDTSPTFPVDHFAWNPPEGSTDLAAARPQMEQSAATALVGKPAPAFKLDSLSGKSVALSDLKGQVVLLDFWASWCPPCVESLPHLGKLYGQEQDGVKVLAINLMEDRDAVKAFAAGQKINVPILLDASGTVAQKYRVGAIPQTVLIGPDGVVREVFVGLGQDMYSQLAQAIQKLKAPDDTAGAATKTPAAR